MNNPERKLEFAGTVNTVAVFKSHLIDLKLHSVDNKAERATYRERLNDETLKINDAIVRTVWQHTESGRNVQIV